MKPSRLAVVAALALLLPTTASAQDPAPAPEAAPEPGPQADNPWANLPPIQRDEPTSKGTTHQGVFFEGGLYLTASGGSQPWGRLEVGIPFSENLSLVIPAMLTRDSVPGLRLRTTLLVPSVRFDFPVYQDRGRATVHGEAGLGIGLQALESDFFRDDRDTFGVFRVAAGASYVAEFGLMVTVQPVGMVLLFNGDDADANYEFSLMVGYRL